MFRNFITKTSHYRFIQAVMTVRLDQIRIWQGSTNRKEGDNNILEHKQPAFRNLDYTASRLYLTEHTQNMSA